MIGDKPRAVLVSKETPPRAFRVANGMPARLLAGSFARLLAVALTPCDVRFLCRVVAAYRPRPAPGEAAASTVGVETCGGNDVVLSTWWIGVSYLDCLR